MKNLYGLIFIIIGFGINSNVSAALCETQSAGNWSATATWTNCNSSTPQLTDDVNILHAVIFDVDATVLSLAFGLNADFDVAASVVGLTLEITAADVDFTPVDIELLGDFVLVNTNDDIFLGAIDGDFNLTINSSQRAWFAGNHTTNLNSIITDAGGTTRISNQRTLQLSGDSDTVFNDVLLIGASANIFIDQTGAGDVIFNESISKTSGSPHRLTVSNDTGETQFNGTVFVGVLTTNGTANVVISGATITTVQGGANNGDMIFNSPVIVSADTVFTSIGTGDIFFNNSINDDANGGTSSAISFSNPNNTTFSLVGNIDPIDSITTDATGTTTLDGDIETLISTTFNGAVTMTDSVDLKGVIVDFKSDIDNAGFDLTFDTSNNTGLTKIDGVLSGGGNFTATGNGVITFSSSNTLTGNLIVINGTVQNITMIENIFPAVPIIAIENGAHADIGSLANDVFALASGQTIKGTGECGCVLTPQSGAIVSPGNSPGILSSELIKMATGSKLIIELNGTSVGTGYDQMNVFEAALDTDSNGGATLELSLGFIPAINNTFTIMNVMDANLVSGTFNGLTEGATFSTNNTLFSITYTGGGNDNNDVVLTALGSSIIYVDKTAAAMGDGAAWNTAFNNLQDALVVAVSGSEIWVAAGTYYPDEGTGQFNNDPASTFDLINGINLYGGFNGTESELSERNPAMNVTILSGDVDVDDVNLDNNNIAESVTDIRGSNSYHVINGKSVDNSTIFDGFTVTSGNANGGKGDVKGGGMTCEDFGPSINQVMFIGNYALQSSGATFGCTQNVSNTVYMNNHSDAISGAVETFNGGNFDNVIFEGNVASSSAGAIHNTTNTLTIYNSSFINNDARNGVGGAISSSANIIMETVLFVGNKADEDVMKIANFTGGGGLYISNSSNATLTNVTMTGNNSAGIGGAFRFDSSGILGISNSIIWNNQDSTGQGTLSASISSLIGGTTTISNSLIKGSGGSLNWDMTAGIDGGNNLDEEPLFVTDTDPSAAPTSVGDARLQSLSMAIDTGDNSVVTSTKDLNDRDRIVNMTVDMGAYEYFEEQVFADGFE